MRQAAHGTLAAIVLAFALSLAAMGAAAQELEVAPININTADAELLTELPGIGPARAEAILQERDNNGAFESLEDLTRVSGIGEATAGALEGHVDF